MAGQGAGGYRQRTREIHRGFGTSHSTGEVAIGGTDADFRGVQPAEGIDWTTQARTATAGAHFAAGIDQDVFDALFVGAFFDAAQIEALHVGMHFGAAGHDKRFELDLISLEDVGGKDHVGDLSAGAGADVGAIELHVPAIVRGVAIVG